MDAHFQHFSDGQIVLIRPVWQSCVAGQGCVDVADVLLSSSSRYNWDILLLSLQPGNALSSALLVTRDSSHSSHLTCRHRTQPLRRCWMMFWMISTLSACKCFQTVRMTFKHVSTFYWLSIEYCTIHSPHLIVKHRWHVWWVAQPRPGCFTHLLIVWFARLFAALLLIRPPGASCRGEMLCRIVKCCVVLYCHV